MKPKLLKISLLPQQSFSVRQDSVPYFFKELHFHPEVELVHIHKGTGTQFLGNRLDHFKSGDMILVGANLAHLWKSDPQYFSNNKKLKSEATVIHFRPDCLGKDFFDLPENASIKNLLMKSQLGISIHKSTKTKIALLMQQLNSAVGGKKIITLLEILETLAHSKHISLINSKEILQIQPEKEMDRLNLILQYLLENFSENKELKTIAAVANLTPNAFCRYFKLRTKKTYSSFLTELRINHVCKLLIDSEKTISDICYESGFNNFSNFNRYFKKQTNYSPLNYRKKYKQEIFNDK